MKLIRLLTVLFAMLALGSFVGCEKSSEEKLKDAKENMKDAGKDLKDAAEKKKEELEKK